jgi:hypothetical protein
VLDFEITVMSPPVPVLQDLVGVHRIRRVGVVVVVVARHRRRRIARMVMARFARASTQLLPWVPPPVAGCRR